MFAAGGDANLPETVLALPRDSSNKLNEIVTRHRNYVLAKANGALGTSVETLSALTSQQQEKFSAFEKNLEVDECCSLCLDSMRLGEQAITLPCGHRFHAGHQERQAVQSSFSNSKKRAHEGCRGILYWLESNSTCPQCRYEFPTEIERPSESESILVPLLHRQNRLISKQTDLIKEQREKIAMLEKMAKKKTSLKKPVQVTMANSSAMETVTDTETPNLTWQDTLSPMQQEMRKTMLEHITGVALTDIIVRGEMEEGAKNQKLQELAAKIEFILYCCSPSFACYADISTIRQRTLRTVKNLAEKARAMKLDRIQDTETGDVSSMVNL